jgi:hypothetical protein
MSTLGIRLCERLRNRIDKHPCGCKTRFDEARWRSVDVVRCPEHAAVAADPADTTAPPWAGPVEALRAGRVRRGLPARPDPDSSEAPA